MYERSPGGVQPQDASAGRRVEAKVKWFNAAKGFGFVTLSDGSPDAFLPMATLRRAGFEDAREGASISCEVGTRAKGPLVVNVLHLHNRNAARGGAGGSTGRPASRPAQTVEGIVKWFEPDKGYGFISPDGGGKDVFIHITALRRSGMDGLSPGQRVRVEVVEGRKGFEADSIILV